MKPIWAIVECASAPLTSGLTIMTTAPKARVAVPATMISAWAGPAAVTRGLSLTSRTPPALTTPACSSADTGVGAARVAGSQRWKGT